MDIQDIRNLQESYLEVYNIQESHFSVGDEVICKKSGMEGEVVKVDKDEKGKYYTVKREDGKKVKYAPDELKMEDESEGASKKEESKFHKNLDTLVHKTFGKRPEEEMKEQVDIYDIILSHLLDEGYAETLEAAEAMMVNMSEQWRDSILYEGKKPLPVSKMAKQARRIAFSAGVEDASDEGTSGYVPHSNPEKALKKMSKIGGSKVKHHAKKGYEMGTEHDPYYGLGKK